MSHYTMLSKYGNCRRLLKIKNKLKIAYFYTSSREEFSIFCGRFQWNNYSTHACWIWNDYSQYEPRWLSTISYPTRTSGIIVKQLWKWWIWYYPLPRGFSGLIYNTGWGTFSRRLMVQFTINEVMSHECPLMWISCYLQ